MEDYLNALKLNTRNPIYKLEFTDKNEITIDEIYKYVIDGNISCERKNGMRRTCNITLENKDGTFTPSYDGLVSFSNRLKVFTGLNIDNVEFYIPQGVFLFGNPRMTKNQSGEKIILLEMYDKFALLDGTISGTLEKDYMIPIGTPVSEAVSLVLTRAGITTPILIYPNTYNVPYDIVVQAGENYANILYKLADLMTWEVFFDEYGTLRFQPPTDEDTQSPSWEFVSGGESYISSTHNFEWNKIRNNIIVVGDNINGLIIKAESKNENIFSDTYYEKIGLITEYITDDVIYDTTLAKERADYELQLATQIQESADIQCVPIDILKEGDIIIVDDSENGFNRDRYVVRTINIPLIYNSEMTINAYKARQYQPADKVI
jgi:hypothetical protein